MLWAPWLAGRKVIVFIDNDGARHSLIGIRAQSAASLPLVGATAMLAAKLGITPWYDRVPGPCNLGDGPSRLDFGEAEALGSRRDRLQVTGTEIVGSYASVKWPAAITK